MVPDTPPLEPPQPRQADTNQLRFVVNVLSQYWVLIVVCTVAGSVLLGGFAWLRQEVAETRYAANANLVLTPSRWDRGILRDLGGTSFSVSPKALVERTSVRQIAEGVAQALVARDITTGGPLSAVVSDAAMRQLAASVESQLSIEALGDTQKIRIKASHCPTKDGAYDIAEFGARVFLEINRHVKMKDAKESHEIVREELDLKRKELSEAENKVREFKREKGFRTFSKVDEDINRMEEELKKLTITTRETEAKLLELGAELGQNTSQLPEALDNVTEASVGGLFTELDDLLQDKLNMSAVFTDAYPPYQELEAEIAEKQNAIIEALKQLDQGAAGGSSVWSKRKEIYRQQVDLSMQLTGHEVRSSSLERMLDDIIPQLPELSNKNRAYEELNQTADRLRQQFRELHDKEWKIRTALRQGAGRVERFEAVSAASVMPLGGRQRGLWVNFIIGAIAGLVLSFSFAMIVEANDTSIRSIEDVNEYIGLEVIGTIPRMRFGSPRGGRRRRATYVATVDEEQIDSCIVTQHDPKSPISEAYRTLRTNFQFATLKQKPKSLMITSAVPGEGKTTTAVNMAVTMADRGMRVLIVDTDLRRPNVHRVLRMERGPGLADVLREGLDVRSVIRSTRIENLWIISSGRVPPNPSELTGSDRMGELMHQLGGDFDLVICDAPSVLVVTDPVLLATHVDCCAMVVSTNNARRETVIRANKLLDTAKVNVVGIIVNGLETTRRHYYYYYYYYDDGAPVRKKWYHFY